MPKPLAVFLRDELDARGLDEKQFAARAGLGLSHVYQILRGERRSVRDDTLQKIAAGLGMTMSEVSLAREELQAKTPEAERVRQEIGALEFERELARLPVEVRATAREAALGVLRSFRRVATGGSTPKR
jgi:transcriptional regulator with XRE-family HTH domain